MREYTKIRIDIPRGFIESFGDKEGFHCLHLDAIHDYDYTNWTLSELKELAKKINLFIKKVKNSK